MKRKAFLYLNLVGLLVFLLSCQKTIDKKPSNNYIFHFHAIEATPESKTSFAEQTSLGYPVVWEETDVASVTINYGATPVPAAITPLKDARLGTFTATLDAPASGPFTIEAVVPENALLSFNTTAQNVTLNIPASQTPSTTSPDAAAMLLVASKEIPEIPANDQPITLLFHHALAYGCLTLTNLPTTAEIHWIDLTFTIPVSGKWNYSPNTLSITPVATANSITIHTSSSSDIFFACAPADLKGQDLRVRLSTTSGIFEKTLTLSDSIAFTAGKLSRFCIDMGDAEKNPRKKTVVCWGDSLTGAEWVYPPFLQQLLGDEWIVYNGGTGGDRTYEIAARQGGLPLVTGSAFTIPAGTEEIQIDGLLRTHSELGVPGYYPIRRFNGALQNPCKLIGTHGEEVLCNISSSRSGSGDNTVYYATLSRLEAGDPIEIAEHTLVQTYAAQALRDEGLTIILMGANGGFCSDDENHIWGDYYRWDNLIAQHWEMIRFTSNPRHYLVLGQHLYVDWREDWDAQGYTEQFEAEFGQRFLSLKHTVMSDLDTFKYWVLESGLYETEEEIPQEALDQAAQKRWPVILTSDTMHFNKYGAYIVARVVYDRMKELGYLDDIPSPDCTIPWDGDISWSGWEDSDW